MLKPRRWGQGPRRAVLLHGSTSSSATWWQVAVRLAEEGWSVTALDLPGHGDSPACHAPLTPTAAAPAVAATLPADGVDLLVGHSFGAAVAVAVAASYPALVRRLVLEELPGGCSVDWSAEAEAVLTDAWRARTDPQATLASTRNGQPRWLLEDCQHAVADLARCAAVEVSDGLRVGAGWTPADVISQVQAPTTLLLAPDRPGVNRLENATALRGADRDMAVTATRADVVVVDAGHCIHRDDPDTWLKAVLTVKVPPR